METAQELLGFLRRFLFVFAYLAREILPPATFMLGFGCRKRLGQNDQLGLQRGRINMRFGFEPRMHHIVIPNQHAGRSWSGH